MRAKLRRARSGEFTARNSMSGGRRAGCYSDQVDVRRGRRRHGRRPIIDLGVRFGGNVLSSACGKSRVRSVPLTRAIGDGPGDLLRMAASWAGSSAPLAVSPCSLAAPLSALIDAIAGGPEARLLRPKLTAPSRFDRGTGDPVTPGDRQALRIQSGGHPVIIVGPVDVVPDVLFAGPDDLHRTIDLFGDPHRLGDKIDLQSPTPGLALAAGPQLWRPSPGRD